MSRKDRFVCDKCFDDQGLVTFIRKNAVSRICSFCSSKEEIPIAAPMNEVSVYFLKCLSQEYDLANNLLGWTGREDGWYGDVWSAEELAIEEIQLGFPRNNQDCLLPHLFGEHSDQEWCKENPYGYNDEDRIRYSWELFRKVVTHERRFFFMSVILDRRDSELYSPGEVLRTIFEYAQGMSLFKKIPSGTRLLRARWEGCHPKFERPEELGPPPAREALKSNRMSPAGIPMFYACDDQDTALKELNADESCPGFYALGLFETLRPATLFDLTAIPPVPGLFDSMPGESELQPRQMLMFLNHVATEISKPVECVERDHLEYVPTQVVTEFVRDQLIWGNSRVDGIKYFSSVNSGHASYVFFANQSNLHRAPDRRRSQDIWLKLICTKHRLVE